MRLGTKEEALPEPHPRREPRHTYLSGPSQRGWWWNSSRWCQLPARGAWWDPCAGAAPPSWDLRERKMTYAASALDGTEP